MNNLKLEPSPPTDAEIIHIFENSRLQSEYFTPEALTAAYVAALGALHRAPLPDNKALTVFDRITASPEALAEFLSSGTPDVPWPQCTICTLYNPGMCIEGTDCEGALLASLSRPQPEKE